MIVLLKKIVDWTPGITRRQAHLYKETLEWDEAEPALNENFVDTASRLLAMHSGEEQQAAMRWYRRGIQADNSEDQFTYFWFALEIAAEKLKGTERVTSKCPRCSTSLYCEKCQEHPTHRRYSGEAIKQVVHTTHPQGSEEVFKTLQRIRHTLLHGGRIQSVINELPCDEEQAINKLAYITWQAIGLLFDKPDPSPDQTLAFGYVENVVRRKIVGEFYIATELLRGDPNDPKVEDFPTFNISMDRVALPDDKPLDAG